MSHLSAFSLCLAGFAALALATERQHRNVFARPPGRTAKVTLRTAGAGALLGALGVSVGSNGWGLGLVMFSGHTSLSAGIIYCALLWYSKVPAPSQASNGAVRAHARRESRRSAG